MASSPRSMWSGTIQFGLIPIPVTVGKSWSDTRDNGGLRDICATHKALVDRTERCSAEPRKCGLDGGKQKGVVVDEKVIPLAEGDLIAIEDSTKSDTFTILDVQPVYDLPLEYGTGTYYLRFNDKVKGFTPDAFAHMLATLNKRDEGLVVKWCKSARQQLAVIHASNDGKILMLTTIPFANELRLPGDSEKRHAKVEIQDEIVSQMGDLLDTLGSENFDHAAYEDHGQKLRGEAVDKLLKGEKKEQKDDGEGEQKQDVPDLMAALQASMKDAKLHEGDKQEQKS